MIEDPSFPWGEFLAYCITAITAFYAGRCNTRLGNVRTAGRSLAFVLWRVRQRGVYLSPFEMAIINESQEKLK